MRINLTLSDAAAAYIREVMRREFRKSTSDTVQSIVLRAAQEELECEIRKELKNEN